MFDLNPKPQFHTYPLRVSQLSRLTQQMSLIDQQIYQNRQQIQQIRQRFQNQQYQTAYITRLHQKTRILQLKRQQLQQINRTHQYHQASELQEKRISLKMNTNLANEYKTQIEDNRRRRSQEKQEENRRDREMVERNMEEVRRIQEKKEVRRQGVERGNVVENRGIQQGLERGLVDERQAEKLEYSQHATKYPLESTEKLAAFQQFYKSNQHRSQNLQKIYKTSTLPRNQERINHLDNLQAKHHSQYLQNQQTKALSQQQRISTNKQNLKQYLQSQIQEKQLGNERQKQTKQIQDINRSNNQVGNQQYNQESSQKHKLSQHLYSSELAKQLSQQTSAQRMNSQRSRQHTYLNQSTDVFAPRKELNSPESPKSGVFLGNQKARSSMHNPLVNPVPFSIGMSNPYVVKWYESQRVEGSTGRGSGGGVGLSKLAQLGGQAFH